MSKKKKDKGKADNPVLVYPCASEREAPSPGHRGNRKLYVVSCISNPVRTKTRVDLYKKFAQKVEDAGAILYTIEMAFGDRPHSVTSPTNHRHVQLRSYFEIWHKENMLKIGMQNLPEDWEYVAWIDSDVTFAREDWVNETIEQLQHYRVIQMFSHAQDLSPRHEPMLMHTGFIHDWYHGSMTFNPAGNSGKKSGYGGYGMQEGHPGYAWAARREAIDNLGGLIDWAILGSADRHMACALIGEVDKSYHPDVHPNYKILAQQWQDRADKYIKRDVGYMDGLITHAYHGRKSNRGYTNRWKILVDHQFDPIGDIYPDAQGLLQIHDDNIPQRDAIRRYFRSRFEDDISEGMHKLLS